MFRQLPEKVSYDYKGKSFIVFTVEDLALVKDFQSIMPQTKHFCEKWNVPFDYVIDKFREKGYLHKALEYGYEIHGRKNVYPHSQLVQEKCFHTSKTVWYNGNPIIAPKEYYDVYIIEDSYASLCFKEIIPDIIKDYYNWLYVVDCVNKFDPNLPVLNTKLTVDNYSYSIEFNHLTLEDIAFICNNPETWRDYKVNKFIFNYYYDMLCCKVSTTVAEGLDYDNSIVIPLEAILKKDWSIVENYNVFSIRDTRPDRDKWYEGKQKESPYWDTDKVKEIQKLFEK